MRYYVGTLPYSDELSHFGIKGQKWGVRRYQNPDGTLTAEGKARYGSVENLNKHRQDRKQKIKKVAKIAGAALATAAVAAVAAYGINYLTSTSQGRMMVAQGKNSIKRILGMDTMPKVSDMRRAAENAGKLDKGLRLPNGGIRHYTGKNATSTLYTNRWFKES